MPSPHLLQVTIGAGVTRISSSDIFARTVQFQNNAANDMRIGDSTTTTSKGIQLYSSGGASNVGPLIYQDVNLADWYVAGTADDVLDILYL